MIKTMDTDLNWVKNGRQINKTNDKDWLVKRTMRWWWINLERLSSTWDHWQELFTSRIQVNTHKHGNWMTKNEIIQSNDDTGCEECVWRTNACLGLKHKQDSLSLFWCMTRVQTITKNIIFSPALCDHQRTYVRPKVANEKLEHSYDKLSNKQADCVCGGRDNLSWLRVYFKTEKRDDLQTHERWIWCELAKKKATNQTGPCY